MYVVIVDLQVIYWKLVTWQYNKGKDYKRDDEVDGDDPAKEDEVRGDDWAKVGLNLLHLALPNTGLKTIWLKVLYDENLRLTLHDCYI